MNYIEENECIVLSDYDSFNIGQTLKCGQAFRFFELDENEYVLIAHNKVLNIKQKHNKTYLYPCSKDEFENIWYYYFDFDLNYKNLKEYFKDDDILLDAINYGEGIRILNQEPLECLITFIISQNNRIPMIKTVVNNICERFGEKVGDYYSFPTLENLQKAKMEDFRECKAGFRDKYLIDCIEKVTSGEIDFEKLKQMETAQLKNELMKIKGVGSKVADCVILFSFNRKDSFPVDVWIKRIMEELYFDRQDTKKDLIEVFAKEKFGEYRGLVQQYLFNYAHHKKIVTK